MQKAECGKVKCNGGKVCNAAKLPYVGNRVLLSMFTEGHSAEFLCIGRDVFDDNTFSAKASAFRGQ